MTGRCKFDGIYFFYFFPTQKRKKGNPIHIAHIAKAPRANFETKPMSKSTILPTPKENHLFSQSVRNNKKYE
jgi:hypothetical protein